MSAISRLIGTAVIGAAMIGTAAADGQIGVSAADQDVSGGTVRAETVMSETNGWLVIHRTDESGKPGPVVGHAPIAAGTTNDVAAILTESVASGDRLMLMVHGEAGGTQTGIFEYTLGAEEDGPVRVDGALVAQTITAQ